jgi:hypothetical protein
VKVPADAVLSPPKSNTATAGSPEAVSLYIKAPLAVIVTPVKDKSAKSVIAVFVAKDVPVFTSALPPEEYPPVGEDTWLPVVKDVVDFPNVAELVYIANLNELPPGLLKLCVASKSCFLKELQIAFVVIAIFSP